MTLTQIAAPLEVPEPGLLRAITVLQVVPALVTGGVERGTVDVAGAISAARGIPVVASSGGPMVRELERLGARHVQMPLDRKTPWAIRSNARRLTDLIETLDADIVHARSRAPAWSAFSAARSTRRPFVTTFHATYNFKTGLKRWYNSVMARGDRVIAISNHIADHILKNYSVNPDHVRVIPRGVDVDGFDPARMTTERLMALSHSWRLPDGVPLLILPGRVTRWKGHGVLVEALAKLARRDLHCLFVGSDQGADKYKQEISAQIEARGLSGQVRFVGDCRDMAAAYMLADVVVAPSTDPEGFGRVAAEAGAMGRPMIAADHGGARETVIPGETGWLTRPGDASELAGAIEAALDMGSDGRAILAANARAHVAANFSKGAMTAATLAVYNELL